MFPVSRKVRELLALAHHKSAEDRRTVFRNISDLFLADSGRLSERERMQMAGIVNELVHDIEISLRREFAARLADEPGAPRQLAAALADERTEIAHPILERGGILNSPDLIDLVKRRVREYRLAAVMRSESPAELSALLPHTGERDAIEAMTTSHDTELARRAMDYLVSESQQMDRFKQPLLRRSDLPPPLAHKMFWWVSAALREHILAGFGIDATTIDVLIQEVTAKVRARAERDRSIYDDAGFIVAELARKGPVDDRFLCECLRHGHIAVLAVAWARMADIDTPLAQYIILDPGGEGLAVLSKACGIDRAVFSSVFRLTREAHDRSAAAAPVDAVTSIFDQLTRDEAEALLRFWQLDADYVAAVERIRIAEAEQRRWGGSPGRSSE